MTCTATCRCGELSAKCTGELVRVSVCHCYDCQKRSRSAFAAPNYSVWEERKHAWLAINGDGIEHHE